MFAMPSVECRTLKGPPNARRLPLKVAVTEALLQTEDWLLGCYSTAATVIGHR